MNIIKKIENISLNNKITEQEINAILDVIPFLDYGFDLDERVKDIKKNKKYPFYKYLSSDIQLSISFIINDKNPNLLEVNDFISFCEAKKYFRKKDDIKKAKESYLVYCELLKRLIKKSFKSKVLIGIVLSVEIENDKQYKFISEYKEYFKNCLVDIDYNDDSFLSDFSFEKIKKAFA